MKKIVIFLISIIAFVLSFFFDKQIIGMIVAYRNIILNNLTAWLTYFSSEFIISAVIILLFVVSREKRRWIFPLAVSFFVSLIITIILKFLVGRVRPFAFLSLQLVKNVNYNFSAWNTAFPSLHTAVAFAAFPILAKEFPRFKWFWFGFVCFIAFTRLYIGVHYLSDVIAGALIGVSVGLLFIYFKEHKIFKF